MTEKDIQTIDLVDLKYNKEYKSKIVMSNAEQENQIILITTIPDETVKEIQEKKEILKNGIKTENNKKEEIEESGLIVYTKKKRVYYCYGKLKTIYKRLVNLYYKIIYLKLNSKGLSIYIYAYLTNKYNLKIENKNLQINEFVKSKIDLKEKNKKMAKLNLLFSNNRFRIKIDKNQLLKEETPINNGIKITIDINQIPVSYDIGIKDKKIKMKKYYYAPIKSTYIEDFSFHIRRTCKGKLVLVKRKKEEIENNIKYKLMESKPISLLLYRLGKWYKAIRRKKVNVYFEKYSEKVEEGTYQLFCLARKQKSSKNFFIIDKKALDYDKIKQEKNIIKKYSLKYYWLLYSSNSFITTEAPLHSNILRSNNKYLRKSIYEKKFIFLQHGITYLKAHEKNSAYLKGKEAEPTYIIAGSEKEKDVIFDMLKIEEEQILVTGLPIFSTINYKHINEQSEDIVTIMLTWKPYEEHLYHFEKSSYYQNIIEIMKIISKYIDKEKIVIVPHPKVLDLLMNTNVKQSVWTKSISQILAKTKLLITDYSSVCYNAFYQGAGIIFYQNDLEIYEKENGKLIPEQDEYIGKRAFKIEELENIISQTIKEGKIQLNQARNKKFEENYKSINQFNDGKNIERIYQNLVKLKII